MDGQILLLTVSYVLLATLVLALCLFTRWQWWIKTGTLLLTGAFFFVSYDALAALLGYPTPGALPERFLFHYAVVEQPKKASGDKGAIYMWATALNRSGPSSKPRAYLLPFDASTYDMLTESQKRARQGIVQMGKTVPGERPEGSNMLTRYLSASQKRNKLVMQDMPEPALPEK